MRSRLRAPTGLVRSVATLLLTSLTLCMRALPQNAGSPYGTGDASPAVRADVMLVLQRFQDGYTRRDSAAVASFVEALFAPSDVLVLGIGPTERYEGRKGALEIVRNDWRYWGDVRLVLDGARVSSAGDVAWVMTRGSVTHGSGVIPLRFSAVLVKDAVGWRFRQVQFQADLDPYRRATRERLLLMMLGLVAVMALVVIWALARKRAGTQPPTTSAK